MPDERSAENPTPWWRSVPAILTASATFVGSIAALLALFVGPGGFGGSNNETPAANPTPTPTEERTTSTEEAIVPVNPTFTTMHTFATEEDVQELLRFVPASLRSRCKQEPKDEGDALARFSCEIGGATLYYELYPHELDALDSFRTTVSLAEVNARGRARSCVEGVNDKPFIGTWTRPGQARPAGRQLCVYGFGFTNIHWTESGRPIVGSVIHLAQSREASWEGAKLAWDQAMR